MHTVIEICIFLVNRSMVAGIHIQIVVSELLVEPEEYLCMLDLVSL